jgi:hypothetical protein
MSLKVIPVWFLLFEIKSNPGRLRKKRVIGKHFGKLLVGNLHHEGVILEPSAGQFPTKKKPGFRQAFQREEEKGMILNQQHYVTYYYSRKWD